MTTERRMTWFRDADLEAFIGALGEVRRLLKNLEVRVLILEGPEEASMYNFSGLVEVIENGETIAMTIEDWAAKHPDRNGFWDCANGTVTPCDGRFISRFP